MKKEPCYLQDFGYERFPPKVEYYMSEMGKGLRQVVRAMYEWIEKYDIK